MNKAPYTRGGPALDLPTRRSSIRASIWPASCTHWRKAGRAFSENSEVSAVEEDPLQLRVGSHNPQCRYVMIATHCPIMGKTSLVSATLFQTKLALYTSYVLGAALACGDGARRLSSGTRAIPIIISASTGSAPTMTTPSSAARLQDGSGEGSKDVFRAPRERSA